MERGGEDSRKENSIRGKARVSPGMRHSVWQKYKQGAWFKKNKRVVKSRPTSRFSL